MTDVTRLDDLLGPLEEGIWEVAVPKESVTEPLDGGWERSVINIPTPGTIASYRKGHYHAHETVAEWKVHVDRYDPKVHPVLHLLDDAPLLLMIADTFITLVAAARRGPGGYVDMELKEQRRTWQVLLLAGCALGLIGLWIFGNPMDSLGGIVPLLFPVGIIALGVVIARRGISLSERALVSPGSFFIGISLVVLGVLTFDIGLEVWIQLLLLILASWAFGSAYMSFSRVARGRRRVPEGFFRRLGIGVFSFVLAAGILIVPDTMLEMLMETFGVLVFLLGIALASSGWRLREKMRAVRKDP